MRYNTLGSSGLEVSAICLGTMTWGHQNSEAEAHAQLDYALSQGVNFIDTAELYPVPPSGDTFGTTERYLGSWLRGRERDKLVVATKITGPARGFDWFRGGPRITREHILAAVDTSLARLQTDYIDLYQIHWPDRYVPMFGEAGYDPSKERECAAIEEQLAVFAEVAAAGKVRYFGLSNETPWGVAEFVRLAEKMDLPRVVSVQNAYSLINRIFEGGLDEVCHHTKVGLLAYSPLAFGWLTGKYLDGIPADSRLGRYPMFGGRYDKANVREAVGEYAALAKRLGMSPATLALAFINSRWFVTANIIGATTMEQLRENMASIDVTLSDEVLAEIDAIHARYPNPAP